MDLKVLTRSDGKKYTLKDNKDRFLFPEEYIKFDEQLKRKQIFSVRFLINTGARINESRNVKVEDCDIERKRIILRVTKTKAKKGEKYGKPRIIPISSQFAKYLKRIFTELKLQPSDYLPMLSNASLNNAYKIAARNADIRDYWNISSHTFRKTLEVWLMALGVESLPLVAHIGHDIKTAAMYYVSPDIFSFEDKKLMRMIIGDLYQR